MSHVIDNGIFISSFVFPHQSEQAIAGDAARIVLELLSLSLSLSLAVKACARLCDVCACVRVVCVYVCVCVLNVCVC